MRRNIFFPTIAIGILLTLMFSSCKEVNNGFDHLVEVTPLISGKTEYLASPMVTAGNRVYLVGNQDGSFPEIGWHIQGEMGGIWNHPIKLMDGFDIDLIWQDESVSLDNAHTFTNLPFANRHSYSIDNKVLELDRWQFVPDDKEGLIVQLVIKNKGQETQNFEARFTGNADLRPTWLGERTEMIDYPDFAKFDRNNDIWIVKDSLNPWSAVFGADTKSNDTAQSDSEYMGKGVSAYTSYDITISPNGKQIINFFIAGSYKSETEALNTYNDLKSNFYNYFETKKNRYEELASLSKLTIPDRRLQQTFEWLKYNCDWLVRTVPEIGTGIGAGIPDYPWWFGVDSEYALKGYMAIGQSDAVYQTIDLLYDLSSATNGNGRIIHEASTNGAVFNPGNINETPQFVSLIWEIYQWNGDREFLRKYYPTIKDGLDWLLSENDEDNNYYPDGFGMMEIHGLDSEMIDVAAYTQRGFEDAGKMAIVLGDQESGESYLEIADTLKARINREFWSEDFNSFADFIGTDEQALHLINDAIIRADTLGKPWAVEELENTRAFIHANPSDDPRPFVMHHNWVVNTPMEMKIAEDEKALKALATAESFVNPFGVFVTGIDRDESAGSDDGSFKGSQIFSYTGAVMTLPTGVLAVAENNYGRPDKALNYINRMVRSFSYALPGSMYEVSPDYGMMTQAWNIYGFAVPIVQQFFGIKPQAYLKKIVIQPQMPKDWDKSSLENVIVADNAVSVFYEEVNNIITLAVEQNNPEWDLEIIFPNAKAGKILNVLEGPKARITDNGLSVIEAKAKSVKVVIEYKN